MKDMTTLDASDVSHVFEIAREIFIRAVTTRLWQDVRDDGSVVEGMHVEEHGHPEDAEHLAAVADDAFTAAWIFVDVKKEFLSNWSKRNG